VEICTGSAFSADYSDLATSYGVAWHTGDGVLRLGSIWTADTDFSGPDDSDDGVTFLNFVPSQQATVRVNVQGTPTNGRWGHIWFDWNDDGVFGDVGDGERVYNGALVDGNNNILVNVPAGLTQPVNYRVRLYDSLAEPSAQDAASYGGAAGGEVEDDVSPAPTAVRLAAFGARPAVDGVLVTWETISEDANVGFNLYRSDAPGILGEMLNETLIPSKAPGAGEGAAYEFLDATVLPGAMYYYTLEAVDVSDGRTLYGPAVTGLWRLYLPLMRR
jgi:hypothetical protein